tara:strand:- start:1471 stop:2634 length:1164 start_codon:yes stop_codon:yes gene_type:complete
MKFDFGLDWKELRRFDKLKDEERSIVFYAENKASMNHFRLLIKSLTEEKNLQICYITSVKNDPMLSIKNKNILSFYIGNGTARTKFFIFLKAKILIMDMPNLDTFHIKRSKVYPVHYVYIFHSVFSVHSYLKKGAVDNYDTIFCVGKHHENEIREIESKFGLKEKKLIKYGFGRLDTLIDEKKNLIKNSSDDNLIIITPTYGENNLLKICGVKLIEILLESNYKVLIRPHFRIFEESKEVIDEIKSKFGKNSNFILEDGVIPSEKFHGSRCLISDWSGISFEYAFTFEKPVIFIDVPKKVLNSDSNYISLEPIEVTNRNKIGYIINPNDLNKIIQVIKDIDEDESKKEEIRKIRSDLIYNLGNSAEIGTNFLQKLLDDLNQKNIEEI